MVVPSLLENQSVACRFLLKVLISLLVLLLCWVSALVMKDVAKARMKTSLCLLLVYTVLSSSGCCSLRHLLLACKSMDIVICMCPQTQAATPIFRMLVSLSRKVQWTLISFVVIEKLAKNVGARFCNSNILRDRLFAEEEDIK